MDHPLAAENRPLAEALAYLTRAARDTARARVATATLPGLREIRHADEAIANAIRAIEARARLNASFRPDATASGEAPESHGDDTS